MTADRARWEPVADAAAREAGVPVGMFRNQIGQESQFDPDARSGAGAIGIAQIVPRFHSGVDPTDPTMSLRYAAHLMAQFRTTYGSWRAALIAYNWGAGNYGEWAKNGSHPDELPSETRHYLDVILGPSWAEPDESVPMSEQPTVNTDANIRLAPGTDQPKITIIKQGGAVWPTGVPNVEKGGHVWVQVATGPIGWVAQELLTAPEPAPQAIDWAIDTPMLTQNHDWDCAEQSTLWALTALGRSPADAWVEASMLAAGVESESVGLTDASGRKLADWINANYGDTIKATAIPQASFDLIAQLAGTSPILIGGHNWSSGIGHWCGVRRFKDGSLELAQPGGHGPRFGQQTLDQEGWDARGPWSAVILTRA